MKNQNNCLGNLNTPNCDRDVIIHEDHYIINKNGTEYIYSLKSNYNPIEHVVDDINYDKLVTYQNEDDQDTRCYRFFSNKFVKFFMIIVVILALFLIFLL